MAEAVQRIGGNSVPEKEPQSAAVAGKSYDAALWIKWISLVVIVVGIILIVRLLPVENGVRYLTGWIEKMGFWGPVVFGLIYIVAAVLFVPGVVLTLTAGAIFGLLLGSVIVSIASTIAAAVAFLIARYVARGAIERQAGRYPKFGAVDRAIGEGGWKIIALLRLSPAIPYSVGNYLYGLTAIRFWPYVLASWLAMLPGTFMYVYLGHIGRTSLAGAQRTPGQWAMLIVGLIATVVVTLYITYLARKAIRRRISDSAQVAPQPAAGRAERESRPWGTLVCAALAVVVLASTVYSYLNPMKLRILLGPPTVKMKEAYQDKPGGPTFDHSALDDLLKKHVGQDGTSVNYEALRGDSAKLDRYIASLAGAPFDDLGRNEKLALLINAYNAFTLRLILDNYPLKSIQDIPAKKRWDDKRWKVGGHTWSLNEIEHAQIRPKFKEPRVHFALVCAAFGCPPLRREAYTGSRIDEQLEDQTRQVHGNQRWFRFEPDKKVVHLTSLYNWYGGDFEQVAGSALNYAARYSPELKSAVDSGAKPKIEWINYDWSLNEKQK